MALSIEAWLNYPVIPTTQTILTRKDLISAPAIRMSAPHSDSDAELQNSIAYIELVNQFPASKADDVRTPRGQNFRLGDFATRDDAYP